MPPDPNFDLIELPDQALHDAITQAALELGDHHTASPAQRERLGALEGERGRRRRAAMEHVLFNGGFDDTEPRQHTGERPDDDDDDDDYEFVPAHEETGPGGRMDYIYAHWRRKRRRRVQAPDDRRSLAPDEEPSPAPPDGDFDPRDGLREKRLMHLRVLARERGVSYTPDGDVADNDIYMEEMARLGYSPDADEESLSGWTDTPEPPDWDALDGMLDEMGPIDRIYLAFDQLISSGELGQDFWDALPDPHAFVLGLFAIVVLQFVPGVDILLDAYLLYTIGTQFLALLDALSALNTAGNAREFARAREAFGRAVASISIDGIISAATWGLKKLGSTPKVRGPRVQPRPRPRPRPRVQRIQPRAQPRPQLRPKPRLPKGLEELPPDRSIQVNGGRGFGPGGYNPPRAWKPFEAPRPPGPGYYGEPLPRFPEGTRPEPRRNIGRTGRDTRIVELADDPSVPKWIRDHIRRQIENDPTGNYRLPKKGDIGPDGRPLKEDYVLGHEEHTRDPFTGRITKEGRPARENNPYGGTRPISEGLNKFEEAMRRRLEGRYAAHLDALFNRLRRLKAQKRWNEIRRLLREMISRGDVKFENLPAELQALMRG